MTLDCFEHKLYSFVQKWNFKKITNFVDIAPDDKDLRRFVTKKWNEVYDQSGKNYNPHKGIRTETSILRLDLCEFSDAYIVVEGNIIVEKKSIYY